MEVGVGPTQNMEMVVPFPLKNQEKVRNKESTIHHLLLWIGKKKGLASLCAFA